MDALEIELEHKPTTLRKADLLAQSLPLVPALAAHEVVLGDPGRSRHLPLVQNLLMRPIGRRNLRDSWLTTLELVRTCYGGRSAVRAQPVRLWRNEPL